MERNMTATVFDANAHCAGYRKMCGTGFEHNLLKSTKSYTIDSIAIKQRSDGSVAVVVYYAKISGIKVNNRKRR